MHTLPAEPDDVISAVALGRYCIDERSAPYIIAEAGVNHDGSVTQAKQLIDGARQAGAHAIKFQLFTADNLAMPDAQAAAYQGSQSQYDMLKALELEPSAFAELQAYSREQGLEFLATPFSLADCAVLIELGVSAIKLSSTDLTNVPLLDQAIASGRPILMSTGASNPAEIDEAVMRFDDAEACERLILLHCMSSYPTTLGQANLCNIAALRQRYAVWTGFSDHTEDLRTSAYAVSAGAKVLEKHLTIDRSLPGPDHSFSLTIAEFAEYTDHAQRAWQAQGQLRDEVYDCERDVRCVARRSIVAVQSIPADTTLTAEHLTCKRPGQGIEPTHWHAVIGRKTIQDIPANAQLSWEMLK